MVIVGRYMIPITALLAGKHAITVVGIIISQPYVCSGRLMLKATHSVEAADQETGPGDDSDEIIK